MLREAIRKLSDEMIDKTIYNWDGEVCTLPYHKEAVFELGKLTDVIVTSDKKFMYIEKKLNSPFNVEIEKIQNKFNLKDVK